MFDMYIDKKMRYIQRYDICGDVIIYDICIICYVSWMWPFMIMLPFMVVLAFIGVW